MINMIDCKNYDVIVNLNIMLAHLINIPHKLDYN